MSKQVPSEQDTGQPQYLVDAYCGSGLFAITLADKFTETSGVEISADSVRYAKRNAQMNRVSNAEFMTGSAEAIFDVGVHFFSPLNFFGLT